MVVAHAHAIVGEVDRWKNLLDVGHPAPSESKQGGDVSVSTAQDSMLSNNGEHTLTCQQQTTIKQPTPSLLLACTQTGVTTTHRTKRPNERGARGGFPPRPDCNITGCSDRQEATQQLNIQNQRV